MVSFRMGALPYIIFIVIVTIFALSHFFPRDKGGSRDHKFCTDFVSYTKAQQIKMDREKFELDKSDFIKCTNIRNSMTEDQKKISKECFSPYERTRQHYENVFKDHFYNCMAIMRIK